MNHATFHLPIFWSFAFLAFFGEDKNYEYDRYIKSDKKLEKKSCTYKSLTIWKKERAFAFAIWILAPSGDIAGCFPYWPITDHQPKTKPLIGQDLSDQLSDTFIFLFTENWQVRLTFKMASRLFGGHFQLYLTLFLLLVTNAQNPDVSPVHKRFEYKYSFKPPYLAQKDGTVPFFEYSGSK